MDKDELRRIVKLGGTIDTKSEKKFTQVVLPKLIEALGYDMMKDDEVGIDVPVQIGHETKKADYRITSGGGCIVIEAKPPTDEIEGNSHELNQVYGYARILRCGYAVLYNGRKASVLRDKSEQPVYTWKYADGIDDFGLFEALTKDNFPSGLEEILNSAEKLTTLRNYVDGNAGRFQDKLLEEIAKETKLSIDFISDHVNINLEYSSGSEEANNDFSSPAGDLLLLKSFRDYGPETGLNFVKKYKAWGYIRVGRKPDFLGLYDADNHQLVRVYKVNAVEELNSKNYPEFTDNISKSEFDTFAAEGKKILRLGIEIKITPVPMGRKNIFRGKFTTLEKVKKASTTDDL